MKSYLDLLNNVFTNGTDGPDRTGVGTRSIFGTQLRFNMQDGFPAVTTKRLVFKSVVAELLWFLKGSTDIDDLRALTHGEENRFNMDKKTIWDANYAKQGKELGYTDGYVGLIYGAQWRGYGLTKATVNGQQVELPRVDQIREMLKEAQRDPTSRRLVVEALNPMLTYPVPTTDKVQMQVDRPILPPCHTGFQVNIDGDNIDILFKMRSLDVPLGCPFDVASYALLLAIFGRILGKKPRDVVGQFGNTHIYLNQLDGVKEQLTREPFKRPKLWINPKLRTLEDFENAQVDDFKLIDYKHHATISMPMSA